MKKISKDFVFLKGCVGTINSQYFLTFNHQAAVENVPNGQLFIYKQDSSWTYKDFSWTGVAIAFKHEPEKQCTVLGRNGEVLIGDASGFHEERINCSGKSPISLGPLLDLQFIDNVLYCVGMGRQAYKRLSTNLWTVIDEGLPALNKNEIVGFNSIAGTHESKLYAVGWGGEIWRFNGSQWTKMDSPTNLILRCITYTKNGEYYICGKGGTLLKGFGDSWELISLERPTSDWLTMTFFKDILYLADSHGLYMYDGSNLNEVLINDIQVPINYLNSSSEILLVVGADCVFTSSDGITWDGIESEL